MLYVQEITSQALGNEKESIRSNKSLCTWLNKHFRMSLIFTLSSSKMCNIYLFIQHKPPLALVFFSFYDRVQPQQWFALLLYRSLVSAIMVAVDVAFLLLEVQLWWFWSLVWALCCFLYLISLYVWRVRQKINKFHGLTSNNLLSLESLS